MTIHINIEQQRTLCQIAKNFIVSEQCFCREKTSPIPSTLRKHIVAMRFHHLLCSLLSVVAAADGNGHHLLQHGLKDGNSYVFLQKFPLEHTNNLIFHTEVLVCAREGFSTEDQMLLDDKIDSLEDFVELEESWWSSQTANCVEFGYGGSSCSDRCCAVPHGDSETHFPLNERQAVISNADTTKKSLFLYGSSGTLDGESAYHRLCNQKCWSNWAGTDYNPLTNNCNTFTSTVLHCVFGLSEKKPNLGPSDMVTVTCDKCPGLRGRVDVLSS